MISARVAAVIECRNGEVEEILSTIESLLARLRECIEPRPANRRPGERVLEVKHKRRIVARIYEGEGYTRLVPFTDIPMTEWAREYLDSVLGRGRWSARLSPAGSLMEVSVPVDGLDSRIRARAALETLALNLWEYEKALKRGEPA